MEQSPGKFEIVSDLMDGQLAGDAFARAVDRVTGDVTATQVWHACHVVGDVMRSDDLAHGGDTAFVQRLRLRLEAEVARQPTSVQPSVAFVPRAASNDGWFSWKRATGVMSIFAVLAVGWNLSSRQFGGAAPTELASASAPLVTRVSVAAGEPGAAVMIRDSRLDQLIQAHRQWGGGSALQVSSGFLRNATYDVRTEPSSGK